MSGIITGAVFQWGPAVLRPRMVLAAIAEAGDDHGFACLSIESIAAKAVCEPRTAMRQVQWLEREGWLTVRRRAVGGKSSVYFVNIARLRVELSPKSRKNAWHLEFERRYPELCRGVSESGDKLSPVLLPRPIDSVARGASRDTMSPEFRLPESGDKSAQSQVTKCAESGDISSFPIRKNRENRVEATTTPVSPRGAGAGARSPEELGAILESVTPAVKRAAQVAWQAERVVRQLRVSDERKRGRLLLAIGDALEMHCERTKCTAEHAGEVAIASVRRYAKDSRLMRFTWAWGRFFGEGFWLNPDAWPYDQGALRELKQQASASIGSQR